MQVPAAFELHLEPGLRLWSRRGLAGFDATPWRADPAACLHAGAGAAYDEGRGHARRLELAGRPAVWRRNAHGGLLGPLLGRRFLDSRRLEEELTLSETLRSHAVATPEILLAVASRHGPWWRQDLVTARVPGAVTVFAARARPAALAAASELLEELFRIGFWAPDLHPANLLWQEDERRCWLIDLATCRLLGRPLTARERRARRRRFARYFLKHGGAVPAPFDRD